MAVACTQTRRTRCPKVSRTRPDIMPSRKVVWPSHCRPCAYRLPLCTHGTASRFTYSLRGQMLVASQEACRVARNASPTRCCTRAPPRPLPPPSRVQPYGPCVCVWSYASLTQQTTKHRASSRMRMPWLDSFERWCGSRTGRHCHACPYHTL